MAQKGYTDNTGQFWKKYEENKKNAAKLVGQTAAGLIVDQMERGYGKPIRDTGALMRDVQYDVVDDKTVRVGNTLDYSVYVHEGTYKMAGRPYINDALLSNAARVKIEKTNVDCMKKDIE